MTDDSLLHHLATALTDNQIRWIARLSTTTVITVSPVIAVQTGVLVVIL